MASIVSWMHNAADNPDDVYWKRMHIEAEMLCELTLQSTIRGGSKTYYCFKSICLYAIDITEMVQTNLNSGKTRVIRRHEASLRKRGLTFDIKTAVDTPEPAFRQFREARLTSSSVENKEWYDGVHYGKCRNERTRDFVAKHCKPYGKGKS